MTKENKLPWDKLTIIATRTDGIKYKLGHDTSPMDLSGETLETHFVYLLKEHQAQAGWEGVKSILEMVSRNEICIQDNETPCYVKSRLYELPKEVIQKLKEFIGE